MSGPGSEPEALHPFDRTRILPGVPPLPEVTEVPAAPVVAAAPTATLVPSSSTPRALGLGTRGGTSLFLAAAGVAALACWAFLGSGTGPRRALEAEPVAESLPPSLKAYREAAEQGDPRAMRMLGACYTYGLGVRVNPLEGAAWYRRAAKAGDKVALQELDAAGARR
ncbi:MAG TPA: tetratricopeptide repeat protein [Holophagaceae bacterium]|nr:tetratricopeptide repeat protein [Holophagaceae bacterium]